MDDSALVISFCFGLICFLMYNFYAQVITKQISALTRAVCDIAKTLIIWVVGLIFTATFGEDNESYEW
jgi:hypothetical protein